MLRIRLQMGLLKSSHRGVRSERHGQGRNARLTLGVVQIAPSIFRGGVLVHVVQTTLGAMGPHELSLAHHGGDGGMLVRHRGLLALRAGHTDVVPGGGAETHRRRGALLARRRSRYLAGGLGGGRGRRVRQVTGQVNGHRGFRSLLIVNPGTVGASEEERIVDVLAQQEQGGQRRETGREQKTKDQSRTVTRRFVGGGPETGRVRGVSWRVRFPDFSHGEPSRSRKSEPGTGR